MEEGREKTWARFLKMVDWRPKKGKISQEAIVGELEETTEGDESKEPEMILQKDPLKPQKEAQKIRREGKIESRARAVRGSPAREEEDREKRERLTNL